MRQRYCFAGGLNPILAKAREIVNSTAVALKARSTRGDQQRQDIIIITSALSVSLFSIICTFQHLFFYDEQFCIQV